MTLFTRNSCCLSCRCKQFADCIETFTSLLHIDLLIELILRFIASSHIPDTRIQITLQAFRAILAISNYNKNSRQMISNLREVEVYHKPSSARDPPLLCTCVRVVQNNPDH